MSENQKFSDAFRGMGKEHWTKKLLLLFPQIKFSSDNKRSKSKHRVFTLPSFFELTQKTYC